MHSPEETGEPPGSADGLPRHTTPTWEVELLISGVAVFAMLQLPDLLDKAIFAVTPRVTEQWGKLFWLLYVYSKGAALILAATFVVHLLLRARWIALVGVYSIHPRGVDWQRLRLGPIGREVEADRMGRIEDAIERADNRATMVFAIGVILASILVVVTLAVAIGFGAALWLEASTPLTFDAGWFGILFACLMVPYAIALMLDRHFGDGLPAGSARHRALRGLLRFYSRLGLGMANNPALAMLSSHHGRRRTVVLIATVMTLAMIAATSGYYALRNPDSFGSYDAFPSVDADQARAVDTAHYDDERNPETDAIAPYIQSAVIKGPYLRLVVPYEPRRDDAAIRNACPDAVALQGADRVARLLDCLQRLHAVALDGKPLTVAYDSSRDPRTERPALLAMIDVRALKRGRHELRISSPPVDRDDARTGRAADRRQFHRIAFWR